MGSGTPLSVLLFMDFWNIALNWQQRAGEARMDWKAASRVLFEAAIRIADPKSVSYSGTRVYASFDPARDTGLLRWLHNWLDRQPGLLVLAQERKAAAKTLRCRECRGAFCSCPNCGVP